MINGVQINLNKPSLNKRSNIGGLSCTTHFVLTDFMTLSPILKAFLHNSTAFRTLVINKISSLFHHL